MDVNTKRVLIIDFNHLAHAYLNSGHRLSKTVNVGGVPQVIDTTIQNGTIKLIHKWSRGGACPTAVCFDSPVPARKRYFSEAFDMGVDTNKAYKGGRKSMPNDMYVGIDMVRSILHRAGVSIYQGKNYEADDLIYACIQRAKEDYPDYNIDVVTNDADLLPLVDDKVSVFLRSKKTTWAECPALEKNHYVQVTPANYQEVIEDLTAFKKFKIPYNSVLLHKLLRGDSADNLEGIKKKYPPKKYNAIIDSMVADGVDFGSTFRYGDSTVGTGDCPQLAVLMTVLSKYITDEEDLAYIKAMYKGMNLNQGYYFSDGTGRNPARLTSPIKPFSELALQKELLTLDIHLKLFT